jgi:hypothetical protein
MSDRRSPPPKTKYRVLYRGEWRPVITMLDAQHTLTTQPMRAVTVVLFIDHGRRAIVAVGPAEVMENTDYRTSAWESIEGDN